MTDFEAIDALLDSARQEVPLPPAGERRALREGLNLSRSQVAQALGVGPSTVGGWEAGREPAGEVRERYAYFLDGARKRLDGTTAAPDAPEQPAPESEEPREPALAPTA
ncbi:helix-turn-helix domain-containing protein, partial [Streptomyces sp. McG7]|nr:helix-turn-helix transcriptional regulator [Streptomyces sp. McG7]